MYQPHLHPLILPAFLCLPGLNISLNFRSLATAGGPVLTLGSFFWSEIFELTFLCCTTVKTKAIASIGSVCVFKCWHYDHTKGCMCVCIVVIIYFRYLLLNFSV